MASRQVVGSLGIMVAFLAVLTGCQSEKKNPPASPPLSGSPVSTEHLPLVGTGSCSARGCHGGFPSEEPSPKSALPLNEYSHWLLQDKHASAFDVLFNDQSRHIAKNLNLEKAHEADRCLACHTNPQAAIKEAGPLLQGERFFGVGCESCHGDARAWLKDHTTVGWAALDSKQKKAKGMLAVGNLVDPSNKNKRVLSQESLAGLAKSCAGCHIGSGPDIQSGDNLAFPARDMNHDLIAAGHPRLNFEFGTYLANLSPHWSEKQRFREGEVCVQAWLLGQVASAEAAVNLLAHRAGSGPEVKGFTRPWPEFAEYDCFACHHDLQAQSWRQTRPIGKENRLGMLPWGTWYFTMPEALAQRQGQKEILSALASLRTEMQKPSPDKSNVAEHAHVLANQLSNWQVNFKENQAFLQDIVALAKKNSPASWDSAAQLYLALLAHNQALPKTDPQIEAGLNNLYQTLAFPFHFDSPKENKKDDFPARYLGNLDSLLKVLKR